MIGSFEDGQVVIRMSVMDAKSIASELFYTIDYRPDEHPEYAALQAALYQGLGREKRA